MAKEIGTEYSHNGRRSAARDLLSLALSALVLLAILGCGDSSEKPSPLPTSQSVLFATPPSTTSSGTDEPDTGVVVELDSTATPYPTATAYPTATPYPTATAYPTTTPFPTATAYPTTTPFPTATAYPTTTPSPTVPSATDETTGPTIGVSIPEKTELKLPRAESTINILVAKVERGEISAEQAAKEAPLHRGASVGVIIHLSGNVSAVAAFLEANGATNISSGEDYIEAFVPILSLEKVSEQSGVLRVQLIQPPESPRSNSGTIGNGQAAHGSKSWNDAGYGGQDIKVGVIDDGFQGFQALMGDELPSMVEVRCYRRLGPPSDDLADCTWGGPHGTSVSESIIDIAPEASLYIANPLTMGQLMDVVDWMISEGVSVINQSLTWPFDGPGNGSSPLSVSPLRAVDRAVSAGIVWVNSAGNNALQTWFKRGPFSFSTLNVDGEIRRFVNFSGPEYENTFYLEHRLELRWEDSWGRASRDLDLYLVSQDGSRLAIYSIDEQSGGEGQNPYEWVSARGTYSVMIEHFEGSEPGWIQLLSWAGSSLEFATPENGSITNPAESASPGMLTVGAADWNGAHTIRPYSSRGPTPDGRIKPDVVAADCGAAASWVGPFCGTSQAAPHVAGMAALIRQRFPEYTPAQVVEYLNDNARQIGSPDPNNTWGHGFFFLPEIGASQRPQPERPGVPTIASVTPRASALAAAWHAPARTGEPAIEAYDLRYIRSESANKGDAQWTVVEDVWTGSGSLSYELTGIEGGRQYDLQVRAVNAAGDGPWSATEVGTPTAALSIPGAPVNARYRHEGSTTIVTWDPAASSTHYKVYYSDSTVPTCSILGSGTLSGCELLAGDVAEASYTHAGPDDENNSYWIIACNDAGCSDIDRGNPARLEGATPAPDLVVDVVDAPTVSDSTPVAGARFNLNATVRNQGTGRSDSTTLHYYRSTDSTITSGDTEVGTDSVSGLNASGSGDESISLTAPSTSGTYYYGACVDAVSGESSTTNNCSSAVQLTVGAAPAPDLVVESPTVSYNAPAAGTTFTLSVAVRNQGTGRSDSTTLRYYRSTDSTITSGDTELDTDYVFRLDASESGDEDIGLTAPSTPGTYYYGACVDALSDESSTTNNCSTAVQLTVGAAPAPDLVVDNPTVSDNTPAAGARFNLSVAVRNQGTGRSDSTTLRYYRSTDSTITSSDTPVGTDSVSGLAASGSGAESINVTAPSDPGTYYYGACVDAVSGESNTTNNCSSAVQVTVGAAPAPDLVVDNPTVSDNAPAAGTTFTLSVAVRNQGTGRSDFTDLRYYRSTDSTITSGDTEIGTDSVSGLNTSASGAESISLTAPSTSGTYYYGACVDAVTNESDTTNNCSVAVIVIVSAVTGVPSAPTELTATPNGETQIDLSWNAPSVEGGAPVTGYRIEDSINTSTWGVLVADTGSTVTVYSHTGLAAGSTRYYRVSAINSAGTGPASNIATGITSQESSASVSAAEHHTCGVRIDGTVSCWGSDAYGKATPPEGEFASVSAAEHHTCGVRTDGTVFCWGSDAYGKATPPEGEFVSVSAAEHHTCGVKTDGTVACWGANRYGRATGPEGEFGSVSAGDSHNCGVRTDGTVFCWGSDAHGKATPPEGEFASVSAGGAHTCGVRTDGSVECWGWDGSGRATPPEGEFASVSAGGTHTCGVTVEGDSICWGSDEYGQATSPGVSFTSVSAGYRHSCGITTAGTVFCWGWDQYGQATPPVSENAPAAPAWVKYEKVDVSFDTDYIRVWWPASPRATWYATGKLGNVDAPATEAIDSRTCLLFFVHVFCGEPPYKVRACNDAGCSQWTHTETSDDASAPDLVVNLPTVDDSSPDAGESFTLSATVRNQGSSWSSDTTLRYYRSTDASITTGDTPQGTDSVSGLDGLETGDESISVTAPSDVGTYYYGACIDSVSGESDTTNNCSVAVTVTVGAAPVPDLIVDTPTVSESAPTAGASFTLRATVRNQGNGSSSTTTLRYYRSTDASITTGDTPQGTDSVSGLDGLETEDESISVTAPSDPGTYYYGACVDALSDESSTTNNCSTAVQLTVGAAPAPDLVVESPTVSDNTPAAGASFTLSVAVRNQGTGRSDFTDLRYYRSSDSTISTSDTEVATDSVSGLNASASGDEDIGLTAPSTPGTYYYGACVDALSDESNTTNNCSTAVQLTVGAAPAPDLVVDTPTVSDSTPVAGARFTLSVAVRNQGTGVSGSTTLRYYRSSDSTISTSDTPVGTDSVSGLNASASGDESISLTAPSTSGTYYYGACVDALSDESSTTNNCSTAVQLTVGAAPAPDLVVESPTVSDNTPAAGASFTLSVAVRNQGTGRSDFTDLRYYRSSDSTISTSDTEVATDSVSGLNASASGDEDIGLTAPSTPGTYYYGACVDALSDESNTTNNCSTAVQLTVGAAPAPDLVVDTPTVSDSTPVAGARFTLSVAVRNQGTGVSGSTTLRYYRSSDSTISTSDTPVGTDSVSGLNASASGDESISLTAPSTSGTYYYGACVDALSDESSTTNNCSTAVQLTVGAAPAPDLVVESPTVSDNTPAAGASFTLSVAVRNQGTGRSDFTDLRYYRSSDSTISTSDTEVATDSVSGLNASASGDEDIGLTAPSTPGTYYYGACVDALSDESNTTNNCSTAVQLTVGAAPAPDLVVESPTVSDSTPVAGASFTLSVAVRNQGTGRSDFTDLRYYRSSDSTISTSDTEVGTDSVSGLNASASGDESISLTAPSTSGTYYYGACVDALSDESSTTNNCSTAVQLTVGAAPAPDLVVESPTVSDNTPAAGASFTLSVAVRNQGTGVSGSTTLRYYRSSDSTISTSDTPVGTDSVSGLAASGSGAESINVTAPSDPGNYYYGACVVAVSGESSTTNNCSSAVQVTVGAAPAPDLVVDTPTVSDSTPVAGARFTLNATVRNQGTGRSDFTDLRYYRSSDSTITSGDTEVGTEFVRRLNASASRDENIGLTAPSTPGTYYYGACVDAVSGESSTTNNCSVPVAVTVVAAIPDLAIETPTVSDSSPHTGESFTLSVTVLNQGNTESDFTELRFYRSKDSTISSSDTQLARRNRPWLDPAESEAESIILKAPSSEGTYYFGACVNAVSGETDTANNCSAAVTVVVVTPTSDLVVSVPTFSNSSPPAGTSFTLTATVRNQGIEPSSSSTTLRYYRSDDSTITASDTPVGTDSVGTLAASGSSDESISLTAPTTPGTYYYGACVDTISGESDASNNCSLAVILNVVAAIPDLVAETPTVSESRPELGDSFTLSVTVRNQGNVRSAHTTLRYYRSDDSTITTADTSVGSESVSSINASKSRSQSIDLDTPSTLGTYYYGACVVAVSGESNTDNNCSDALEVVVVVPSGPDLVLEMPAVSKDTLEPGESFTLSVTVRNQGSAGSGSTTLRYSTVLDTEVGTSALDSLVASASSTASITLTAPSREGSSYYKVCVDPVPGETNTDNNCSNLVWITIPDSIEHEITNCTISGSPDYDIIIYVSLTAIRAVDSVTIKGYVLNPFGEPPVEIGRRTIRNITAGETVNTTVTGSVSEFYLECGIEVDWD